MATLEQKKEYYRKVRASNYEASCRLEGIYKERSVKVKVISAAWCSSCGPYKQRLADAGIEFEVIDADEQMDEAMKYGVRSLPTTVIEKDGELVVKFSGTKTPTEVKKILEGI